MKISGSMQHLLQIIAIIADFRCCSEVRNFPADSIEEKCFVWTSGNLRSTPYRERTGEQLSPIATVNYNHDYRLVLARNNPGGDKTSKKKNRWLASGRVIDKLTQAESVRDSGGKNDSGDTTIAATNNDPPEWLRAMLPELHAILIAYWFN